MNPHFHPAPIIKSNHEESPPNISKGARLALPSAVLLTGAAVSCFVPTCLTLPHAVAAVVPVAPF
jgi:hypothetical protein